MTGERRTDFELLAQTCDIVAAFVGNNSISAGEVPDLMTSVHEQIKAISMSQAEAKRPKPAVPIKKSLQPDHIICLEDGAKLKMLKRYIRTRFNLTPEQYRERWGLPADYPMVAPEYAQRRSELARKSGLGKSK